MSRPPSSPERRPASLVLRATGGPGGRTFAAVQALRRAGWAGQDLLSRAGRALRPAPGPDRPGTVVRSGPDGRVRALVDPRATPDSVHQRTLAVVSGLLADRGIAIVALPDRPGRVRLVVAPAAGDTGSDAPAELLAALAAAPSDVPLQVGLVRRDAVPALLHPSRLAPDTLAGSRVLRAVVPVTDAQGRAVLGSRDGVDIELWARTADGALTAPRRNRFAPRLDPQVLHPAVLRVGGSELPSFAEVLAPHPDDVTFPVDAVFTWVDGDDERWRARMLAARERVTGVAARDATAEARFRGLDELRYALRALDAHAPWVRRVWLVTDGQVPGWLRTDEPRLTVVDHREIWADPAVLPVFNSHAIESQLHHIDGLAEHYLYVNDDVFLGRALPPTAFFEPGGAVRFYPSAEQVGVGPWQESDPAPAAAAKNGRELLLGSVGVSPTQKLNHVPHAQRRSIGYELEERFAADYGRVATSTFRSVHDISPVWLQLWYAKATGRAVTDRMSYRYIDVGRPGAVRSMRAVARRRDVDVFCLNQSQDGSEADPAGLRRATRDFLTGYFPFRSAFERD